MTKRSLHAVAWVLLAVTAFALWPQRWGGDMTYVITSGTSMQPGFQAGDLAVLRSAGDYETGDVAAYYSHEIKQIVMHRVVDDEGGAYRFQGDNNDFVDPDLVTDEQMLGRLVLRVPRVGQLLAWFADPLHLGIAAVALVLLMSDGRPRTSRTPTPTPTPAEDRPVLTVDVRSVDVPVGTVVADLTDADQLEQLARRSGRPVLRDAAGVRLLHDGAVLFRYADAVTDREAVRGSGRDWQYDAAAVQVPRPRRQPPATDRAAGHLRSAG